MAVIGALFGLVILLTIVVGIAVGMAFFLDKIARKLSVLIRALIAAFIAGFLPVVIPAIGLTSYASDTDSDVMTTLLPIGILALVLMLVVGFPAAYLFSRWLQKKRGDKPDSKVFA